MFQRLSLRTILIGGAVLAALVPAVLVGLALIGSIRDSVIREATARYELLAKGLASEYGQFLSSHRQAVRTLADHVQEYRTFGERSVAPLLARTRASYPALLAIAIVEPSGRIALSDPPTTEDGRSTIGLDVADREWFQAVVQSRRPVVDSNVVSNRVRQVTRHVLRERRHRLPILLAEDNPVNQRLAVRLVERLGHVSVVARTGHEVLEALQRERFDLVLMDVQMPGMDGLEATAAIRDLEAQAASGRWAPGVGSSFTVGGRIPVVAVTAHAMKGDRERCLAAGMDGYLTKPIRPAELASAIERWLPREGLSSLPSAPSPTPARATPPTSPTAHAGKIVPSSSPPVDLEAARRLAAGDEDLRAEIAAIFVESWQQQRLDLRNALQASDRARIAQIAHTLKGASGTVGAATAQALAGELEALSREGHQDRLITLADELERELGRAAEFLTSGSSAGSA